MLALFSPILSYDFSDPPISRQGRLFFSRLSRFLTAIFIAVVLNDSLLNCADAAEAATKGAPGTVEVGRASVTYFARGGDTLISIALQFTDKASNWVQIGQLNRIDKNSAIPIGTAILIPGELLGDIPAKATVVAITGTITATAADGSATRLALGATVVEGTRIETGGNSFLTLALIDRSRISVPSHSRVRVAKLRTARYINSPRTEMLLLRGRVESQISPLEANRGRFEVRTPMSVAGVRGTHFRVGYVGAVESGRIATETLAGKVAIGHINKTELPDALLLPMGKGAITLPQSVGPAVDLLPAPKLAPATPGGAPDFAATHIAVTAVPGAQSYHLQIATDAEVTNLIAETYSSSTTLSLEGIADGAYFTRLSAIDRLGLEGFVSTEAINLRAAAPVAGDVEELPSPPSIGSSDDSSITLRWKTSSNQTMRLQLARDSDFSYLLVSRLSSTGEARLARPVFGTYYARVQRIDADGVVRASSLGQPFIVTDQWVMNDGNAVSIKQSRDHSGR